MNQPDETMTNAAAGAAATAEPEMQTRPSPHEGDPATDWLCAWCLNRVASERDRIAFNGQTEFAFKNPAGIAFIILTFARTLGCRRLGVPTLEHTWFPGHAWSY
ncbi:MAG: cereblon family protein, partial [Verrucomicrobiae bacterium]|nr:cereblon family protein [Verrucomicrobiae bacterium]